ncbi:MAG: hypothetical protein ACQESR_21940 [Planctomycetota bacterium]
MWFDIGGWFRGWEEPFASFEAGIMARVETFQVTTASGATYRLFFG